MTRVGAMVTGTAMADGPVAADAARDRDGSPPGLRVVGAAGIALLTVVAAWLRWPALAPGSLWLDDAWVALVGRADGLADVAKVVVTAPLHTLLVAASLAAGGGESTLAAQLPSWLVGVGTPAATYVLMRRVRVGVMAALAGATVVAVAPVHVLYASRVKPYTLDALLAVALLYLAVRVLQGPVARRWMRLVLGAVLATVASSTLAIVSAGAVGVPVLAGLVRGGAERRYARGALVGYLLPALLWWGLVLRTTVRPGLTAYWQDHFVPLDQPEVAAQVLTDGVRAILTGISPLAAPVTVALLVVVLALLALRRVWLPLLVVVPVVTALALAVLQQVPWGGGRTDTYLVGVLAVAVALAVDHRAVPGPWPVAGVLSGVVTVALLATGATATRPGYPQHDVRAFVDAVDPDDVGDVPVIVYPATRWAFALYTDRDLTLVEDPATANGFEPRIEDPAVTVLPPLRATPEAYREHVAAATDGVDRVWFVASHWAGDLPVLLGHFGELGFDAVAREEQPGALLIEFARR